MTNPRSRFENEEEYLRRQLKEAQDAAYDKAIRQTERILGKQWGFPENDEKE